MTFYVGWINVLSGSTGVLETSETDTWQEARQLADTLQVSDQNTSGDRLDYFVADEFGTEIKEQ